ncbi:uncharacterized protein V6R79_001183 [Siganus canaliculatus]
MGVRMSVRPVDLFRVKFSFFLARASLRKQKLLENNISFSDFQELLSNDFFQEFFDVIGRLKIGLSLQDKHKAFLLFHCGLKTRRVGGLTSDLVSEVYVVCDVVCDVVGDVVMTLRYTFRDNTVVNVTYNEINNNNS